MVDPGDVAGLRDAIDRLMTDQNLRRRLGAGARKWANKHASRATWLEIMIGALRGGSMARMLPVGGEPTLGLGSKTSMQ
jgi:hypothetical protein